MDNKKEPEVIKFADIKQDLVKALEEKIKSGKLKLPENVNLVDGFINQLITMELSNTFTLGGPSIPMILLVGDSGQIYFFALKALLPEKF